MIDIKSWITLTVIFVRITWPTLVLTIVGWIYASIDSGFKLFLWNYNPDDILFVLLLWALSLPLTYIYDSHILSERKDLKMMYKRMRSKIE